MTNPTLERAARACARAFYEGEALDEPIFFETYGGRTVDELVEEFWPEFVPEARAVLVAVRTPTNKDAWIGAAILQGAVGGSARVAATECFEAMIDAILAEGE